MKFEKNTLDYSFMNPSRLVYETPEHYEEKYCQRLVLKRREFFSFFTESI